MELTCAHPGSSLSGASNSGFRLSAIGEPGDLPENEAGVGENGFCRPGNV